MDDGIDPAWTLDELAESVEAEFDFAAARMREIADEIRALLARAEEAEAARDAALAREAELREAIKAALEDWEYGNDTDVGAILRTALAIPAPAALAATPPRPRDPE